VKSQDYWVSDMPQKGQLKDMDAWEQEIRDNAEYYTTIAFQPRRGQIPLTSFERLDMAIAYAQATMQEVTNRYRCVMVYAINEDGRHALCGTVNQFDKAWKPVVPQTY